MPKDLRYSFQESFKIHVFFLILFGIEPQNNHGQNRGSWRHRKYAASPHVQNTPLAYSNFYIIVK